MGLRLSDRLQAKGVAADVLVMTAFRRANVEVHLRQLKDIDAARRKAELDVDLAEAKAAAAPTAPTAPPAKAAPAASAASR